MPSCGRTTCCNGTAINVSDVLHYHLATNRWELTNPVELPLGQTYSNTSYPDFEQPIAQVTVGAMRDWISE